MNAAALSEALNLSEKDPHQFGTRPCPTCNTITNLIGRPFGCNARHEPSAEYLLKNLLAVIYRDGGQHADNVGLKVAAKQAEAIVVELHKPTLTTKT